MDDHLSCRAAPNEESIFIEVSCEAGGSRLLPTAQSHIVALHHREDRTLQDHRISWKTTVLSHFLKFDEIYLFNHLMELDWRC